MLVFIIIFIVSYYRTNTTLANAKYTDVVAEMCKVPGYRGVPTKNGAGLYRAGVAELQQHIIRISIMSTKT